MISAYTKVKAQALDALAQAEAHRVQETLNLDALTPTELEAITHPKLKTYAKTKARAMKARTSGDIAKALLLEDQCDRIYRRLPANLQW
jgi:hypothetical protein